MPSGKRAGETRGPTKKGGKQKQSLTTEAASQGTSSFSLDGSSGKLPTPKKSKTIEKTGSTSISESILTHFSPIATRLRSTSDNMNETENSIDRDETGSLDGPSSQLNQSPIEASPGMPTNADIMKKLCSNGYQIEKLGRVIEELRGTILLLQLDNDRLKKEVEASKIREQKLRADLDLAAHRATLADDRSNFLEQYSRNYNLRMYYLEEPDNETAAQCEDSVLKVFHDKMNLRHIRKQDLDAVHRLGVKKAGTTRGIIVRFVSRKTRDEVIANRRKLKKKDGKSVVIVEDLTKRNYHLYNVARDDPVVKLCWTVRGKIFVKAHNGKIIEI